MNNVEVEVLNEIVGGTDVTATLINSIVNIIKSIADIGIGLGSSIRRIAEGNVCPLK